MLGGGATHGSRELRAAELYLAGVAPLVVTTGGPVTGRREATYADWSIERLERRGVPRSASVATYTGESTISDAAGVLTLALQRRWTRVLFVTDQWHTRRASVMIAAVFDDSPVRAYLTPAADPDFLPDSWWLDETSALLVTSEYVKLAAYYAGV